MYVAPFLVGVGVFCIAVTALAIVFLIVLLIHDSRCRERDMEAHRERMAESSWKSRDEVTWDAAKHGPTVSRQWPPISRW